MDRRRRGSECNVSENAVLASGAATGGRSESVEPYLAGSAFAPASGIPYPRALPADAGRLPADTWAAACLPVGVRLELTGDAAAIEIDYTTATEDLGYRGPGAGTTFAVYATGQPDGPLDEEPAVLGAGTVRLALGAADARPERWTVYLPEGMRPTINAVRGIEGDIRPTAAQPRWLCYGDSIAEGWVATSPAGAWPAVLGRQFGLDTVNLGYAGAARGEMVMAEAIAQLRADVISISHGTNCWTRIPHSAEQVGVGLAAFIDLVRTGHPTTPIVVLSPLVRPDAEATPNKLGATLADLRAAIEETARARLAADPNLTLLEGAGVVSADQLPDGIHPGDDGHRAVAAVVGPALMAALR